MTRVRSRSAMLALMVLCATARSSASADGAVQKKQETPVFGAGVTLVAVPVFVTDKAGKAVRGLKAEDFEIEDGGKKVPAAALQAIDVDDPVTAESTAEIAELPVAMQAAAPRQFLILIDRVFSPPGGLFFGRKAAGEFIRNALAPGDLVAVAAWGSNGLKVLTNFTTNHAAAARAIDGNGPAGSTSADPLGLSGGFGGSTSGFRGSDPLGSGGINASGSSGDAADAELAAQDALMKEMDEASYRLAATALIEDLRTLVKLLSPLHGRKQIVLLSSGFSEWAWATPNPADKAAGEPLNARMERVFKEAGQSDVVIHTITLDGIDAASDVGQVQTHSIDGSGPPNFANGTSAIRGTLNQNSGRATLTSLAENTGGRFIRPTGDFGKALGEVDRVSRYSYVVAFEAAESNGKSDKPRSLKIRVRRDGVSVSHRPSYTLVGAPKTGDSSAIRMEAAEAINKGLSGGALRLHLTTVPYRDPQGQASVNAVLHIGGPALEEAAKGAALAVQVYGYAMRDGGVLDSLALNTSLDLAKFGPALRTSGIDVLTAFPVSQGNVDVRFFVRTGALGVTGSIQRKVAVPAFAEGQTVISAPMFTTSPSGKLVVPFQPQSRPPIKIPFYFESQPFIPEATVTLTPGRAREVCVFVWRDRGGSTSPFNVAAEFVQSGQAQAVRIEGAPRMVKDTDGFERYLLTVVPPDTAPGDYTLRLIFTEPGTGKTLRAETGIALGRQ